MATTTPPRSRIAPAAPATGNMPYEVVNGQVVEKPPMGAYETWIASRLMRWMISCDPEGRFGQVVIEMLFRIDRATELQLRPDLAFVSHARWPRDRPAPREAAWDVVPDLAVEVVSPSDSANEVIDKLHEYFQAGVQQVWLVYPRRSEIYVYEAPTRVRILGRGDELDGEALLPGFRLPMATCSGASPRPADLHAPRAWTGAYPSVTLDRRGGSRGREGREHGDDRPSRIRPR